MDIEEKHDKRIIQCERISFIESTKLTTHAIICRAIHLGNHGGQDVFDLKT